MPLLDVLPKINPANFGSADWRYGAVGLLVGSVVTPIIGLTFAGCSALIARHRGVLLTVSVVSLVLGLLLIIGGVTFLSDFGAVAPDLSERVAPAFRAATTKTVVVALLAAGAAVWLGLGGLQALRAGRTSGPEDRSRGLVVGH